MPKLTLNQAPLLDLQLPGIAHVQSGKVREIFDLGNAYLFVATDRISAFDCVMPNGIPGKGSVLTQISHFWFDQMASLVPNHRITRADTPLPAILDPWSSQLEGRSMVVRKAEPLAIECVVRGYLAGSGWKEYQLHQTVCGLNLPEGLTESSKLPEPIFTPATKATTGHDENISFDQAAGLIGKRTAETVKKLSIEIYRRASDYALTKGIIIADTKFEFGYLDGELLLIDEVLTPDSSRFWPAANYQPGQSQASFDKQFVRDYLEKLDWNKTPPAPVLPTHIVDKTTDKYLQAFGQITGWNR
ncbi:MAG: phosphoribosylaminoimidazolesuccinocarboxamide synthase [Verrucomicrobiota bacterium]|jgi:phosphoribosylaminoimidazole-succinocarboxamide synthase|nr:phosphoribosylaminoimidazolesuccinocarboxamide synthase [Verrucomicrobiota bacterium]MDG1892422.1 phosphoribosylaminoimidazolesuccinocarboxamide synthase [Verrucomicrobiota bacterium]